MRSKINYICVILLLLVLRHHVTATQVSFVAPIINLTMTPSLEIGPRSWFQKARHVIQDTFYSKNAQSGKFVPTFKCLKGVPVATCQLVTRGFKKATSILETILQIRKDITIKVNIVPQCTKKTLEDSPEKCLNYGTIATNIPLSSFLGYFHPEGNPMRRRNLLYPQALVKQFSHQEKVQSINYNKYDMFISLSAVVNWYLGENLSSLPMDYVDIVTVCVHEIIHGLGFYSTWGANSFVQGVLSPLENVSGYEKTVFDGHIYAIDNENQQLEETAAFLSDNMHSDVDGEDGQWPPVVTRRPSDILAMRKMYTYATTPDPSLLFLYPETSVEDLQERLFTRGLQLSTNDPPVMILHTENRFRTGSSISHVHQTYALYSPDFLMGPYFGNQNSSIRSLQDNFIEKYSHVGPGTKKILQSLGWSLIGQNTNNNINNNYNNHDEEAVFIFADKFRRDFYTLKDKEPDNAKLFLWISLGLVSGLVTVGTVTAFCTRRKKKKIMDEHKSMEDSPL